MAEAKNFGELMKQIGDQPAFRNGDFNQEATVPAETVPAASSHDKKEESVPPPPSGDEGVSEQRVPYSRFKKANDERIAAQQEAEYMRQQYSEALRSRSERQAQPVLESIDSSLPGWWVKLYGDSSASRDAYKIEQARQQEMEARIEAKAEQRAINAVQQHAQFERQQINSNVDLIDSRIDELSAYVGRDITEDEEAKVLDIVDEYTPKDQDGNYLGDIIGLDKAWNIYQLSQNQRSSASRASRSRATALTGSKSDGEPVGNPASAADFDPRDWNAYKKRL